MHEETVEIGSKVFLNCQQRLQTVSSIWNTFHCGQGVYISTLFMCDNKQDCPNRIDEAGCICNNTSNYQSKCKFLIDKQKQKSCSKFYRSMKRGNDGVCKPFDKLTIQNIDTAGMFTCLNGTKISSLLVNDLFLDCGPSGEDEMVLQYVKLNRVKFECSNFNQLHCLEGHPRCYNVSDICSYKLNTEYKVTPCRNGVHLQNCGDFSCNMKFKCPNFYCIPWGYICDGKWDCPLGVDERNDHKCGISRTCMNMFKCRNSQICIHTGDICNAINDCPDRDDEILCELKNSKCPRDCECLTYVISCYNSSSFDTRNIFPYTVLYVSLCSEDFTLQLVSQLRHIINLNIKNSNVRKICGTKICMKTTVIFDVGHNQINFLNSMCFSDIPYMALILLNNNIIRMMSTNSFYNLSKLLFVNLKNNFLLEISSNIMMHCKRGILIFLDKNKLKNIASDAFVESYIKQVTVSYLELCCLLPDKTECLDLSNTKRWFITCSNILPQASFEVLFCFVCIAIAIVNSKSISVSHGAFGVSVIGNNCVNILYSLYFMSISFANGYYKVYPQLKYPNWTSGPGCFLAFGFAFAYNLMSPAFLIFQMFIRLMIVIHPLDSVFKKQSVIFWYSFTILCFITPAVFIICLLIWIMYKTIPLELCYPFGVPSESLFTATTWFIVLIHIIAAGSLFFVSFRIFKEN